MSKTAQRLRSAKSERQKRYELGAKAAKMDFVDFWYPTCMAWRAGFLQNGGKKFWDA